MSAYFFVKLAAGYVSSVCLNKLPEFMTRSFFLLANNLLGVGRLETSCRMPMPGIWQILRLVSISISFISSE